MSDYPNLWKRGLIQQRMYARAGWRCEHCGMEFVEGTTLAATAKRRDGRPYVLTIHHLDGDKHNCATRNLLAVCQRCHLHIQALWQPGAALPSAWDTAPQWMIERGLAYQPMCKRTCGR